MPIVVKGLMSPHDARLAVDNGAAGVLVSNHAARRRAKIVGIYPDVTVTPRSALPLKTGILWRPPRSSFS